MYLNRLSNPSKKASAEVLGQCEVDVLKYMEHRLLFLRRMISWTLVSDLDITINTIVQLQQQEVCLIPRGIRAIIGRSAEELAQCVLGDQVSGASLVVPEVFLALRMELRSWSKLVWSFETWEQHLDRSADVLGRPEPDVLKYLEHRLLFVRYSLLIGWSQETGKKKTVLWFVHQGKDLYSKCIHEHQMASLARAGLG